MKAASVWAFRMIVPPFIPVRYENQTPAGVTAVTAAPMANEAVYRERTDPLLASSR